MRGAVTEDGKLSALSAHVLAQSIVLSVVVDDAGFHAGLLFPPSTSDWSSVKRWLIS